MNAHDPAELHILVRLEGDSGDRVRFRYEGTNDLARQCIEEDGNIDLRRSDIDGPVHLWFELERRELDIGENRHALSFAAPDSFRVADGRNGQFYGHETGGPHHERLHVVDRNDDGGEHKYTLAVKGHAGSGEHWLSHDPIIRNGPVGAQ